MALTQEEIEKMPKAIEQAFSDLEIKILEDLIARIRENNEITGTAEYDIYELVRMGESEKVIKNYVKKTLKLTYSEIENIFGDVFETGYNRDYNLFKAAGADFVAYKDNEPLQQFIGAIKEQTKGTYKNITNTMGFVRQREGVKSWIPLTKYYKDTLSRAVFEITSGAYSYEQVVKRTINEMTNSGIRTIDYASGRANRIEVAARRAILTAVTQVTAKVTEQNMEKLHTEYVEVSWHETARPTHQVWQGRVFRWNKLYEDVLDEWLKDATPNSHEIIELDNVTVDGMTYTADNINVKQNNSERELEVAKLLEKTFGGEILLIPEVSGIYRGVSTPDYKWKGENWDLKELKEGTGQELLRNIVHKKRKQSDNYIFDITKCKLSYKEICRQVDCIYTQWYNTKHADKIMLINGDKILNIFKKK